MAKALKSFLYCFSYFVFLFFSGCSIKSDSHAPVKIGVSIATMRESVYVFMQQAMLENSKKLGAEIVWLSSGNNIERQKKNIKNLVDMGVDVIIYHAVDTGKSYDVLKYAIDKNIPVVAMDRCPNDVKVSLYVTADSYSVGTIQAQYLASALKGRGKIIIIQGEEHNNVAEEITKGNIDMLLNYPGIEIIGIYPHKSWDRNLAKKTMENLNKRGVLPDGILCNNSSMAMGVLSVYRASKNIPLIVGADADFDSCKAIIDGLISADVDKKPYELGLESLKSAVSLARNKTVEADKIVRINGRSVFVKLTPIMLVKNDNVLEMKYRWKNLKK